MSLPFFRLLLFSSPMLSSIPPTSLSTLTPKPSVLFPTYPCLTCPLNPTSSYINRIYQTYISYMNVLGIQTQKLSQTELTNSLPRLAAPSIFNISVNDMRTHSTTQHRNPGITLDSTLALQLSHQSPELIKKTKLSGNKRLSPMYRLQVMLLYITEFPLPPPLPITLFFTRTTNPFRGCFHSFTQSEVPRSVFLKLTVAGFFVKSNKN